MALSHLKMLYEELDQQGIRNFSVTINVYLDSSSAIAMGSSFRDTKHTRHILRRFHFVRHGVETNQYRLLWVGTEDQLADIGTKNLLGPRENVLVTIIIVKVAKDSSAQEV